MDFNNTTFIFKNGRKSRLSSDSDYPKEFFYSYHKFNEDFDNVNIVEQGNRKNLFISIIFKTIRKLTRLPIYTENFLIKKNLSIFSKTQYFIITNQNLGYSMLPILTVLNLFKKINVSVFVTGVTESKLNDRLSRKLFNNLMFSQYNQILFLSKSEYKIAIRLYPKYSKKYFFVPFPVDINFWTKDTNNIKRPEKILFIGNDLSRDYEFLEILPKYLINRQFIYVTEQLNINNFDYDNLTIIGGNWGKQILNDKEMLEIFDESRIVIIPLKNNNSASGQSVTLQAMSQKIPVLITATDGFFDYDNFKNYENIFFLKSNQIDTWVDLINNIFCNEVLLEKVSQNAYKTILENYTIDLFYKNLLKILSNN